MRCFNTAFWALLIILSTLFPAQAKAGSTYSDLATWQALASTTSSEDFEAYASTDSPSGSYTGFTATALTGSGFAYVDFTGDMSLCDGDGGVAPEIEFVLDASSTLFGLVPQSLDFSHEVCGYYGGSLVECIAITSDATFTGYEFASLVDTVVFDATVIDSICAGTVYTEADNDGDGYTTTGEDCNDSDPLAYPGVSEVPYDGSDNDCDSSTLDDDLDEDGYTYSDDCDDSDASVYVDQVWCEDADLDGYSSTTCVTDCHSPGDTWSNSNPTTDCDDADSGVNPGATEVAYDGVDNDCDGSTLDDDLDGDGYGHSSDCDDSEALAYPGGTETCDGIDNDCDGTPDDGTSCYDDDLDGYTEDAGDCNDASAAVSPGEAEVCNGRDDNCDEVTDEGFDSNDNGTADCLEEDLDEDGYILDDCEPTDASSYPGATETCDEVDNDCDSVVDEETECYDDDGDTWTELAGDCDDANPLVNPAVGEHVYDGVDNDCDDSTLDDDLDQDGYDIADDCDDLDATIYPGAEEVLDDGIDQDCDGSDATTPIDTGIVDDTGSDTGEVERTTVDDGDIVIKGGCGCQVTSFGGRSVLTLLAFLAVVCWAERRRE